MTDIIINHEAIWELIPWYVNASLTRSEADAVERHRDTCSQCAEEIEHQLALAASVCMHDPFESPQDRSWQTLRARIDAEAGATVAKDAPEARHWQALQERIEWQQTNGPPAPGWLVSWTGRPPHRRWRFALAGTFSAALLIAVFAFGSEQGNDWLRTLPRSLAQSESLIMFETVSGVDRESIEHILENHQLTLVDGLSSSATYRASAPKGLDLDEMADQLMATPEITFAVPEESAD